MGRVADLAVVILAAGEGTRMRSPRPKVLHPVCGRTLLEHALSSIAELEPARTVCVLGCGADEIEKSLHRPSVEICIQSARLGTAHAVLQAKPLLGDHAGPVLILYGDHPLFRAESFARLLEVYREESAELALLTGSYPDRSDFGRIVRGPDGRLERIVEAHDATPEVRDLREVNLGVYVIEARLLFATLERVGNENRKGEYYLTELVPLVLEAGGRVATASVEDWNEALGVNSRVDLARAEAMMRSRIAEHWMMQGVTFQDPSRTYVDAQVEIGPDTVLAAGACLRGRTRVGAACRIDAGCVIEDSILEDEVWLKPHCAIEQSELGRGCIAGPSAHLRPGSRLGADVRIGNFVEVKNSVIGAGTKADHLSYIGDADVGSGVTFACGAITVNYDGVAKRRTTIGDGAFVGCNANLIAPVTIEPRSYVAAGSTITSRVVEGSLAVARGRQRNIEGWFERHFGPSDED